MAIGAGAVWEVRTTGSDENGAAYDGTIANAGTDYTQQDAAQLALTDLANASGSTTLTSVTGGFTAAMIGNAIRIRSGTNFTVGYYIITAYTDTNTVTIDRAANAGANASSGAGKVGGAAASIGQICGTAGSLGHAGGNDIYVASGTYNIGTGTAGTSGNRFTIANGATAQDQTRLFGYTAGSSRTTETARPVLSATGNASASLINTGTNSLVRNIEIDFNTRTSWTVGITMATSSIAYKFVVKNYPVTAFSGGNCYLCEAIGDNGDSGGGAFSGVARAIGCIARNGATYGFASSTNDSVCAFCISDTMGGAGFDSSGAFRQIYLNCIAYNCTGNGFYITGTGNNIQYINCYAEACAFGFSNPTANNYSGNRFHCAAYNNSSGPTEGEFDLDIGFVTVSAGSPLTDPANGDFSLNNTASRGALLRATGFPPSIVGESKTTSIYFDIGLQHADPAATGGILIHPGMSGGVRG